MARRCANTPGRGRSSDKGPTWLIVRVPSWAVVNWSLRGAGVARTTADGTATETRSRHRVPLPDYRDRAVAARWRAAFAHTKDADTAGCITPSGGTGTTLTGRKRSRRCTAQQTASVTANGLGGGGNATPVEQVRHRERGIAGTLITCVTTDAGTVR